jgi:glucose-6-phosphate-specific signal transduction histidine kinase
MDWANIVPGSVVGVLVVLVIIFIVFKIIKVVIPLAVAIGLVLLAWKLGWLAAILPK